MYKKSIKGGIPWPKTGDLDILEHLGMDPNKP